MSLYNHIEQAIRQHQETILVDDGVQESDIRHAIRWVKRDNPDIFWFVHQYYFDQNKKSISLRYQFSKERSELIKKSIEDVVENDFQMNYVRLMNAYEQVMYVYKWLLAYCNYNINSAYNQNIDSVFVRRNSVCTGYAKAAQYLFKLLGIESRLVFGRLNNDNEDGRHCWNVVCIEGTYYHLDVCLGDPILEDLLVKAGAIGASRIGDYNYNCFCVSTEEISKTRSIEDSESLPNCDRCLPKERIEALSKIPIKQRNSDVGCLLSCNGSTADIYLCSKDKNVVLKKFRGDDKSKCKEEYGYMDGLRGCEHLVQLNETFTNIDNNIIAIEQSTSIVDLFCSHYYRPTLQGVLSMVRDITKGWQECYEHGILYRDIHVCNIYKSNSGIYKLGDFGSCTYELRGLRERAGNPWFMSPETYISGQFDERSAVYSITAVLYFILNGMRPPFVDSNNEEEALQRKIKGEVLPKPTLLHSMPNEGAKVIMAELFAKGCAFYPTKRIQNCNELLHVIEILRSTIKTQRVELIFVQQNSDTFSQNCSQYNEYIEITATTAVPSRFDFDNDGNSDLEIDCDDLLEDIGDPPTDDGVDVSYIPTSDDVEIHCMTMGGDLRPQKTFCINRFEDPAYTSKAAPSNIGGGAVIAGIGGGIIGNLITNLPGVFWAIGGLFSGEANGKRKKQNTSPDLDNVYSSIFAPAEIKRKSHMLVQVYLHLYEETEKVESLALESDKNAERRDYIPLQCKLKKGDKVDVLLSIYGETLLTSDKKSIVWQGSFTKCSFDYFVPKDIDVDELSCMALLTVNDIPVGEMRFITRIVESPRLLNPEIFAHKYNKIFISYAHKDEEKVKSFHEGLKIAGIEHFFDRAYLKAGDVFPQVIQDYINSADLFVLFWSENASRSEYVAKECAQALELAFPQVKPQQAAKLSIYPISIEPRTELPGDMKNNYHFGEM